MNIDPTKLPIKFGPYQLKQKIASGGMAEIYLAETTGPGGFKKPLVIKMIHHAYSDDKRFLSMFTEEAKILAGLTHGNIVPIFDFGTAHGLLYLAMEFIDGVDAATLMETCRTQGLGLPIDIALHIGVGTAAGLSHAHQAKDRGVVHRDVSPQNILLSRSGEVKLCDFGLATHSLEEISTNDAIKGKLKYLSPEQARGEPVDGRSDLFSLGVVLYELIVGHHPIPTGGGVTVLQELAGGNGYPSLETNAPWIPSDIAKVVDKAVAFDKAERFQSGEEMRSAMSQRLHINFPEFTPAALAELVIRVQTLEEKSVTQESVGSDSIFRAKIASFASHTRERESAQKRKKASIQRKRPTIIVTGLGLLLLSLIVAGYLIQKNTMASNASADGIGDLSSSPKDPIYAEETEKKDSASGDEKYGKQPVASVTEKTDVDASPVDEKHIVDRDTGQSETTEKPDVGRDKNKIASVAAKPVKATGMVNLNAAPWADVSIDGVDYTTTPILGLKLKTGKHTAVFVNPELGATKTRTFTVKADETTTVLVEME